MQIKPQQDAEEGLGAEQGEVSKWHARSLGSEVGLGNESPRLAVSIACGTAAKQRFGQKSPAQAGVSHSGNPTPPRARAGLF